MTVKRISTKFLKITAFILGVILVLMTSFHFWFIHHAEGLVEEMVSSQSNNKLKLKIHKFKFNWFNYDMQLRKSIFYSADTSAATSYQFSVDRIDIRIKEILPLIFEKRILIDSIHLMNPDISVTRLRSIKDTTGASDTSLSIPQEMGKIYNSIQDALDVLKVDRFQIDNGKFSLINKMRSDEPPLVITNISLHLDNLQVDTTKPASERKILFSDNVALRTYNQNILFPDGRHRLSFSNFRINILNKMVEFDSCTMVATKGDSSNNSFSIFFDKLQMTNIDFATLYHNEIIKADSVYCINPRFRLDVALEKRSGPVKSLPKLNDLIQELTGEMQLAFVVVENGSFDINTMREGKPSSFTSDHNNFELQGLQIKKEGPQPLTVEKFAMAIRNYENFLRDSSYSIQFDSILLNNNRISLSNFAYQELKNNKVTNSLRMPLFELQGLSWDELVLEQKLKAREVTLFSPVIDYRMAPDKRSNSQDVFQTLSGIGNFMQLENLHVNNGNINLVFRNNARLQLENANLSVLGRQLVGSRKLNSIQRSVTALFFKKGSFHMGDITANLTNVNFTGGGTENKFVAGQIEIKNKNAIAIKAESVNIHSMIINDDILQTSIGGLSWAKADIRLSDLSAQGSKNSPTFSLKRIQGSNTRLLANTGNKKISVFLEKLEADELSTAPGKNPFISGLIAAGNEFLFTNGQVNLAIGSFAVTDHHLSSFNNVRFKNSDNVDSINVSIPQLKISPDINEILNGKINAGEIHIYNPDVKISMTKGDSSKTKWPEGKVGKLSIYQPVLQINLNKEQGVSRITWEGSDKVFDLTGLSIRSQSASVVTADKLQLSLHKFRYADANGKIFDAGEGKLKVDFKDLEFHPDDKGPLTWKGVISNLDAEKFVVDSLGKKMGKLVIESGKLNNFSMNSNTLLKLRELIIKNTSFRLENLTGSYHDVNNQFNWFNTSYDKTSRILSTDSFSYRPSKNKEEFIATSTYQTDYMTLRTGAIDMGPFDIDRYIKDSILDLGTLKISDVLLTDFRDKRQPRRQGEIRLLPVNMLKKIPIHLLVDTIRLANAHVDYEEWNEKTNQPGKITVDRLNGLMTPVRNFDLGDTDSLSMRFSGYIGDSIYTKLLVKESYTDTLGGFLMKVQMSPIDLTILNPILKPLASAELKSGQLDTLTMLVVGREQMAFGEIDMFYHDLKVRILEKGDSDKRTFLSGIKNFLVNTIVKNKNSDKSNPVFFVRLRDRSAVNYLVKITLNGIMNTALSKKSKKQFRKFQTETKRRNLPQVEIFEQEDFIKNNK